MLCSFQDFKKIEKDITIFSAPFSVKVTEVPPVLKHDIIDLQLDPVLKDRFNLMPLQEFYATLPAEKFPNF